MTIAGDGGVRVAGPVCRPPRFGLLSVADVTERPDDEWAKGLEWDELPCGYDVGVTAGQCPPLPEQHVKSAARGFSTNFADSFAVYAGWTCSTGGMEAEQAWDEAKELLRRNWAKGLELTFWTGVDQDGNEVRSTLGSSMPTILNGPGDPVPAVDLTAGVGVLESFAGDCNGCEPVVHASRGVATFLAERSLIERDGSQLRMAGTGSLFAPGGGYPTSGPGGAVAAPGEAWIYVSGGVSLTHGRTFFSPGRGDLGGAVNLSVNDVTVYAERLAAFQVGCCVGAVLIELSSCCC